MKKGYDIHKLSFAGLLVTLGIIFGDIGTSPLYVMRAIIGTDKISEELVLGGLSCVFWTLTLQTTLKYVVLTLRADNNGEGGIFSLYALVRRHRKYFIWFAIIGGSALLADGIITPPISVTSAVEGLNIIAPHLPVVPIVLFVIISLFVFQRFGTNFMGKAFGPIMFFWFLMLGILGVTKLTHSFEVFYALNPYYALNLIINYPSGFWLLGAVFLCTTGAEALYSDLGHCGKKNIRVSWIFVKICILLNYFGQGAWILQQESLQGKNPFYAIMPDWFILPGVIIATLAAIIASQALITGSFTLVSEAMRMDLWPKVRMLFPTYFRGQMYVPSVNWLLLAGCIFVVLHFGSSENMEAAYGLAISLTMLATTFLLSFYLRFVKRWSFLATAGIFFIYMAIEISFLISNLMKFMHGGYLTIIVGMLLVAIMFVWHKARGIKNRLTEYTLLKPYLNVFNMLSIDQSVPKFATHLVYLTNCSSSAQIEKKVIYSIFNKQPKRADVYWFLHVHVTDEPYSLAYKVETLLTDNIIRVDFFLGFRIEPRLNLFFRKVVEDMVKNHEINFASRYQSLSQHSLVGDFRFVVLEKHLSYESNLPAFEQLVMDAYFLVKKISLSEQSAYGLDTSAVHIEKVPLVISPVEEVELIRLP